MMTDRIIKGEIKSFDWDSVNNMEPEETKIREFCFMNQKHEPLVEIRAAGG